MEQLWNNQIVWTAGEVLAVIFATWAVSICARLTLSSLHKRFANRPWVLVCGESILTPLRWLIWGAGALVAIQLAIFSAGLEAPARLFDQARTLLVIAGVTWGLLRCKSSVEKLMLNKVYVSQGDRSLVYALSRLFAVSVTTIAALTAMATVGIQISALLAVGGLGAFAVSWAGKDVVANFFGGLMIYIKRPFTVNDWIMSPNKGFEGTVEDIGWYMTRIRTFERRPMFIPNASLLDAIIENPGRMYNRRIKCTVGLRYDDIKAVDAVTKGITTMLKEHPEIDQRQTLMVHFLAFGPYSLDIEVYCFTKTTDWARYREIQQDVLLKIGNIVGDHDAEIAFPTRTLHFTHQETQTPLTS